MKPKKIDLNQWERVKTIEDLEKYNGLIIVPSRLIDGTQPPSLFYRRGNPKISEIVDITTAVWYKDCRISNIGTEHDYAKRIDWWFDNALKDPDYRDVINATFNKFDYDVKMAWEKAKAWLKGFTVPSARKTYIHKFIWNWLTKGLQMQMRRIERKR